MFGAGDQNACLPQSSEKLGFIVKLLLPSADSIKNLT